MKIKDEVARSTGSQITESQGLQPQVTVQQMVESQPMAAHIKVKARLIIRRHDELLLEQRLDEAGQPFFRPIGGNVEFAETSKDAAIREFYEETRRHVDDVKYLGCLEDIRETPSGYQHEVCFLYEGEVREQDIYDAQTITVHEDVRRYTASWKKRSDFEGEAALTLRPANLLSLLF